MRQAQGAVYFDAFHEHAGVATLADIFTRDGFPEAGPAGARIEFGLRAEHRVRAAHAAEQRWLVRLVIRAGEGGVGVFAAGDVILFRSKNLAPLRIGLDHQFQMRRTDTRTCIVKQPAACSGSVNVSNTALFSHAVEILGRQRYSETLRIVSTWERS
jgi:hypothetical protein